MMPKEYTSVTNLEEPSAAETTKAWKELQQKLRNGLSQDEALQTPVEARHINCLTLIGTKKSMF